MSPERPLTILCISSYEKGQEFLRSAKDAGCRVFLLTVEKLRHASWPSEAIDEMFYMPEDLPTADIIRAELRGVAHGDPPDLPEAVSEENG